jgi:hypothetical protein
MCAGSVQQTLEERGGARDRTVSKSSWKLFPHLFSASPTLLHYAELAELAESTHGRFSLILMTLMDLAMAVCCQDKRLSCKLALISHRIYSINNTCYIHLPHSIPTTISNLFTYQDISLPSPLLAPLLLTASSTHPSTIQLHT